MSTRHRRRPVLSMLVAVAVAVALVPVGAGSAFAGDVTRYSGEDRVATAIAVFRHHPDVFTSDTVIITRSDAYADALTATPLAAALKAAVLTTGPEGLDLRVLQALTSSGKIKKVVIIGGAGAVSSAAQNDLAAHFSTERIPGADRYETAVKIAERVISVKGVDAVPVLLATGTNFPDALAAGAAAAARGAVVLLSQGPTLSPETATFVRSSRVSSTLAVGGPAGEAMASAGVVGETIIGVDRYDTAAKLAAQVHPMPTDVIMASGETYADSLAGAALAALTGAPLVLTGSTSLPAATRAYLDDTKPTVSVLGGPAAVSDGITQAIADTVDGVVNANPPPPPPPAPAPVPTVPNPTPSDNGSTAEPSTFRWLEDLPSTIPVRLAGEAKVVAQASRYEGVLFHAWTKSVGDDHFIAGPPQLRPSWVPSRFDDDIDGTQVYFTATWEGKTIASTRTTILKLTREMTPGASVPWLNLGFPEDVTTDSFETGPMVSATLKWADPSDGTVIFHIAQEGRPSRHVEVHSDDGVYSLNLPAPVPGRYVVAASFVPKDVHAYHEVSSESRTYEVVEDPEGRLRDIVVSPTASSNMVAGKPATFNAAVTRHGKDVTVGQVLFFAGGVPLCSDTHGADGWGCSVSTADPWWNGDRLVAKYLDDGRSSAPGLPVAARIGSSEPMKVKQFTVAVWDGDNADVRSDPLELGVDSVALTRNGRPLSLRASDDVAISVAGFGWRDVVSGPREGAVPPLVTVDGGGEGIYASTTVGTTPGTWVLRGYAFSDRGAESAPFELTVVVAPPGGTAAARMVQR